MLKSLTLKTVAILCILAIGLLHISPFQRTAEAHFDQEDCESMTDSCADTYDVVMDICYGSEANLPSDIHNMTKCELAVFLMGVACYMAEGVCKHVKNDH